MSVPTFHTEVQDYDAVDLLGSAGGVGWQLNASQAAVLVHDMLPYYLQVLPEQVRHRVTEAAEAVVAWASEQDVPLLISSPRPADRLAQRGLGGRLWGQGPSLEEAEQTAISSLHGLGKTMRVQKRSYSGVLRHRPCRGASPPRPSATRRSRGVRHWRSARHRL